MSQTITITAVPGVQTNQQLPATGKISVVDLANGTPFDLTYSGFGCPGLMVIEAGLKVRPYHEVLDTGQMSLLPVNNVGVTGTGIINVTCYFVNEQVPKGTFPVAIPVQIVQAKVSTVTTLVNDGSAVGTQIIESTPSGAASSTISILNDGTVTIKGDVAGVLTTLLQLIPGAAAGASSVLSSDATRRTEILGTLLVDKLLTAALGIAISASGLTVVGGETTDTTHVTGAATLSGGVTVTGGETTDTLHATSTSALDGDVTAGAHIIMPNNTPFRIKDTGAVVRDVLYVDAANGTDLQAAALGGVISLKNQDGTTYILITDRALGKTANADLCDWSSGSGGVFFKGNPSVNGKFNYQGHSGNTDWSLSAISTFTGTTTGTYSHNMLQFGVAATPDIVLPMTDVSGSQTMGYDTVTTTQVHITSFSSLGFKAACFKF